MDCIPYGVLEFLRRSRWNCCSIQLKCELVKNHIIIFLLLLSLHHHCNQATRVSWRSNLPHYTSIRCSSVSEHGWPNKNIFGFTIACCYGRNPKKSHRSAKCVLLFFYRIISPFRVLFLVHFLIRLISRFFSVALGLHAIFGNVKKIQ